MTTLEELEAEAAELYPINWTMNQNGGYVRQQKDLRATHVRAKSITADEYADVLRDVHHELVECSREGQVDIEVHGDPDPYAPGSVEDRLARAALDALGFYVEGEE